MVTAADAVYVRYFWSHIATTGAVQQDGGWSFPPLSVEGVAVEIFDVLRLF
jgi:hypothetical protein